MIQIVIRRKFVAMLVFKKNKKIIDVAFKAARSPKRIPYDSRGC